MSTSTLPKAKKNIKKITEEETRKTREEDNRVVSGIFRCYEPNGGSIKFHFKKHKGDVYTKRMFDGTKYDVPMMVAKHLNKNCYYERHAHILDADGNPTIGTGKKIQRCSFESLEFQENQMQESE